jgi:hypothetical protein
MATPSSYAGMINDVTEQKNAATDGLSAHRHVALPVVERLRNLRLAGLLEQAVKEAGDKNLREILKKSVRHW